MAKITQITIVDENTLRLEVDACKGDEIDLLSLKEFDTSSLRKIIEDGKDAEYQKQLKKEQDKFKLELSTALVEQASKLKETYEQSIKQKELELSKVITEKEQLANSIEDKTTIKVNEEISKYVDKIRELETEKQKLDQSHQIELIKLKNEIEQLKSSIESKVQNVENQKLLDLKTQEHTYKEQIHNIELKYSTSLLEKDNEILRLKNDRTSLNIKKIGEDLEKWCNNEYVSYANSGFLTSTWEKDNISVKDDGDAKGTKADYIFKIYDTESHDTLITSVCCEMKSEDIVSKNKKKNSDHYEKLEKDRIKKGCEYSLLISELEWDQSNDVPIKRVQGYTNMYVVRPQYFVTFLSVIESLSKKYQSLVLENKVEAVKFEQGTNILKSFEEFKQDLIETSLAKITSSVEEINKQAKAINKAADLILEQTSKIVDKQIQAMINKIEKFSIKKLAKEVDKLEE